MQNNQVSLGEGGSILEDQRKGMNGGVKVGWLGGENAA